MAYTTVLVGLDGSPASLSAVDQAAHTAEQEQAVLVVVCAYHPMTAREQASRTTGLADTKYRFTGTAAAQEALDAGVARAQAAGVAAEGILVDADAVEALLTVAQDRSADLLVVARSATARASRLLGSVASAVVQRAPCDVLVVRVEAT